MNRVPPAAPCAPVNRVPPVRRAASDLPQEIGNSPAQTTDRQSVGTVGLILAAIGGPRQIRDKAIRAIRTARLYVDFRETGRRIDRIGEHLGVSPMPSRLQMWFGGLDMLRFMIVPAAAEYYRLRGINFRLHQLLRFLDDPVSLFDPVGFLSDRDVAIGHLMQVVHLNPRYDVQLLGSFPGGHAELERQLEQLIAGEHPRTASIRAIVEHPDYHQQLLAYVRAYRRDPQSVEMRRAQALRADPEFVRAEHQFSALNDFLRYANRLPQGGLALLRHRLTTTRLDPAYCDPQP